MVFNEYPQGDVIVQLWIQKIAQGMAKIRKITCNNGNTKQRFKISDLCETQLG